MNNPVIRIVDANANAAICTPCGGKCCQNMPGTVFPTDLDPQLDEQKIMQAARALLNSGRYAIDWWEGPPVEHPEDDDNGFFLRPATRRSEGRWVDASWGGACTFHSAHGCELDVVQRPAECKALTPASNGDCKMPEGWEGKKTGAIAWWPHRHILMDLCNEYYAR